MSALKKIKVAKQDILYWEGDIAEEIFFIKKGSVKFYTDSGLPFNDSKEGDSVGEIEVNYFLFNHCHSDT